MTDKPRTVLRQLPCDLTDDEKLEVGVQLAGVGMEIEDLNEQIRKINADKRPKVKLALELTRKLHKGTEERTVTCEVHEGPGINIKIVRTDTGAVVEQRAMTPEERQTKMQGGDWLAETQAAVERARAGAAGGDDEDEGDDEPDNVVPFGGRSAPSKRAARKPRGGGGKGGKGRKR